MTDAMLLLGLLDASTPLPGNITLRPDHAEAVASNLCQAFGLTPVELAERVYRIAIANMAQAVRRVSVQRGFDPRDYALLPCGGAGPLIAVALAAEVGMTRILVPPHPGIFSALGLAVADIRIDYVRADGATLLADLNTTQLSARVSDLSERAETEFTGLGYAASDLLLEFAVDIRYVGQGYELRTPFNPNEVSDGPDKLITRFHEMHQRQYGHSFKASQGEAISFRLTARLPRGSVLAASVSDDIPSEGSVRQISLLGKTGTYRTYQRDDLPADFSAVGPAVVVESTSSMPIPPDWHFEVRPGGAIIVSRSDA